MLSALIVGYEFQRLFNSIESESIIATTGKLRAIPPISSPSSGRETIESQVLQCHSDGSWREGWVGGIGFVFMKQGQLMAYRSARRTICSPLQAEAVALLEAIRYAIFKGWNQCLFCTDSQLLASETMALKPPLEVDWRAFREINEIWASLKRNSGYICLYVPRCQNDLADKLAKQGRIQGWDTHGYTFPIFNH